MNKRNTKRQNKLKKKTKKKVKYSKNYYNNKNGMMTYIWGPPLWHFLHTMSFNYPVKPTIEDKNKYKEFILSMGKILPCKYCRDNFKNNLKNTPLNNKSLKNRENFSRWMFDFHNEVNKNLNKPIHKNYNKVRDIYETFRARCGKDNIKSEEGCIIPINNKKKKCVLYIIDKDTKCKTFNCY